jgi:hypothetical protein
MGETYFNGSVFCSQPDQDGNFFEGGLKFTKKDILSEQNLKLG